MSVVNSNLVIYVSANMPESNSGLTGGAIDSGVRATYEDITSPSQIVSYSSNNRNVYHAFFCVTEWVRLI